MFDIDEYEVEGEEKIRPLPNPLRFRWSDGRPLFDPKSASNYRQRLDFRTGILETSWESAHPDLHHVALKCEVVLHPSRRIIGVRWTMEADHPRPEPHIEADLSEFGMKPWLFRGTRTGALGAGRSAFAVRESGSNAPTGPGEKNTGSIPHHFEAVFSIGQSPNARPAEIARYGRPLVSQAATLMPPPSFDDLAAVAKGYWSDPHAPDIEIEGPVEDQQAIRSFLFYLRSAIHPNGPMSIAPMGLSSETYFGHVFWDADIWVFPALALIEPERAAAITRYRIQTTAGARKNFEKWLAEGRPTGTDKLGLLDIAGLALGAKFSWESSVTGKETVPGPSRFQDHITGSVAFASQQSAALGLIRPNDAKSIVEAAKGFFKLRITGGGDVMRRLPGTMSPDESHTGDDDLYTNLLAQWCVNGGKFDRTGEWSVYPGTIDMYLPRDKGSFLTYEGDPVRSYKQAAAVLAIYPLQFPEAEKQAKAMMDRFADKVSKNGPAMSDSVHALIWARIGEREKAYSTWRKSWQDFTQHPLLMFAEKRSKANTYFATGAGGCLQTVIYGFLGIRIDETAAPGAVWTQPLLNGRVLSVKPSLPPMWKRAVFRNFRVLGKTYTLDATSSGAKVLAAPSEVN